MTSLTERLNEILPRVVSDEFLSGTGIGNEIAFYVFDYPPEDELRVREHVASLLDQIPKQKPGLRVRHVNLFDFVLDYLRSRGLLEKILQMARKKGDAFVKNEMLKGPLTSERLSAYFGQVVCPQNYDLVLLSGVGSAFPLVRTHGLLSNLQTIMGRTPLVMFYPGTYNQISYRLFGKLNVSTSIETEGKAKKTENSYRAFRLVP